MTPEEEKKLEKKLEKRRKLTKKYQQEKIQNYENNDVRNETIARIINNKDELIIKRNKKCLDYYYKNKDELDKKRKELYQQNKERISQETRVLKFCKKIIAGEIEI
jgi:GTP-sensing pleiotropic transcriptional regulator CodY